MRNQILEPLKFYDTTAKIENERIAQEYFDRLLRESKVDVAANQKTSNEYRKQQAIADGVYQKLKKLKRVRNFLIFLTVAGILMLLLALNLASGVTKIVLPCVGGGMALVSLLVIFLKLRKPIKESQEKFNIEQRKADDLLAIAQGQTAPLNALFTERDVFQVIEQTLPGMIRFEADLTTDLLKDLCENYDFSASNLIDRSFIDTVSGRLFENPFCFFRYVDHFMGTKVYQGSLVITYTVTVRDSNGRSHLQTRTQTLVATLSKPYPYYNCETSLVYGHQCAPDLHFSRSATDVEELTDRQVERRVRRGERKLRKKAERALEEGGQFTEMTNSAFDVLFHAIDRDHEVQFRVMFSPLAQNNMLDLLRSPIGYGDDFHFFKKGRYNVIVSEHAQRWSMFPAPKYYASYDVELVKKNFVDFNREYFKSVYFDLAPLLSIPEYHQEPSETFKPYKKNGANYTYYEHEVVANAIGTNVFAPAGTATEVILKTQFIRAEGDSDCVAVTAHSFRAEERLDFVSMFGADGRMHAVPVPWIEYIPIQKTTVIVVKKIGCVNNLFHERVASEGLASRLNSSPNAYVHGLFAKVVFENEFSALSKALDKIKT